MHPRIAVAVGHIDLAIASNGDFGRMIEGVLPARRVTFADGQDQFSGRGKAQNLVRVAIGDPHAVAMVDSDAMRIKDHCGSI
ncbi:MAG TPA: hypothetical protein VNZ48_01945 [Xanthobacteraceae bacterium]|nr:hypothetical protein [Xanthobacteraceae bacterium]